MNCQKQQQEESNKHPICKYEGINNLGFHRTQLTIVLNDNSHSISKSVGALSHYLTRVVTNPTYNRIRNDIWEISGKLPLSAHIRKIMRKTEEGIKGYLTPGALFEEFGFTSKNQFNQFPERSKHRRKGTPYEIAENVIYTRK